MDTLSLEVTPDVISFVEQCRAGLGMADPVPTLIYGRFSDEPSDRFRIALSERAAITPAPGSEGTIYSVPGLIELFVQHRHKALVEGGVMRQVADHVVIERRT